jgi:RNA polymerase sigma-70 factor (ECF subfamily)
MNQIVDKNHAGVRPPSEFMPSPDQLERLYDEHAQALFAFLLNLTRNESDTRDLLQEVFVKLARQPSLLDRVRDTRAFLIRIAHNLAVDLVRRRGARERTCEELAAEVGDVFAPAADPDAAAMRGALSEALVELPADQRVVVHLKLWEAMTFEAIGEVLGISPNTACLPGC